MMAIMDMLKCLPAIVCRAPNYLMMVPWAGKDES
jgi:hypothetical protein